MFLVLEGIDGAGKTTIIEQIIRPLLQAMYVHQDIITTREPGGSQAANEMRRIIMQYNLDPLSVLLLIISARCDHINKLINPELTRGSIVICDRFSYSTRAYQQYGFGLDPDLITKLEQALPKTVCKPRSIYLDISPQEAQKRMVGRQTDRFDSLPMEFYSKVRQGYLHEMLYDTRVLCVDASIPLDSMKELIRKFLFKILRYETTS